MTTKTLYNDEDSLASNNLYSDLYQGVIYR